jgi:hypothetical protein
MTYPQNVDLSLASVDATVTVTDPVTTASPHLSLPKTASDLQRSTTVTDSDSNSSVKNTHTRMRTHPKLTWGTVTTVTAVTESRIQTDPQRQAVRS